MGASLVLLLIACGNVAMLSLSEIGGRRVEMLTRAALGARPTRLIRQLLTESVLLGVFGSTVGIFIAVTSSFLLTYVAPPMPWLQEVRVNGVVLLFASLAGILTGLLFGLAPTISLPRHGIQALMRRGATGVGRKGQEHFQRAVVSLEIASTVVLLVCGGLLARSLANLLSVDPGFRHQHLAEVRVQLSRNRFPDAETRSTVFLDIIDAIEKVPGVSRASGTSGLPFSGSGWMSDLEVEGSETHGDPLVNYRLVLPDFFEVMQIPTISGRTLVEDDHWADPIRSVVVSETMARRFWPLSDPVGRRVRFDDRWYDVVGVAGDVRHQSLTSEFSPTIYVPVRTPTVSLVVRTTTEPQPLFSQIREAVRSVDPGAPIFRMSTVKSLMTETAAHERFRTALLLTFALVAVLLGAAGVFGVTARSVSRVTKEMGIRMALGAQADGLTRLVVWRGLSAGVAGIALGIPVAFATTVLVSPFLFGVGRWDALTYGGVASIMLAVCCFASYVPARRIAALDPVDVLRFD
jgi:putative ABC transport system permease protein